MYGYQDSNDIAPGKSGGKFGLNTGVFLTKFEYNPNSGTGETPGDGIDLTVQVGEREYRKRFFPISKVFGKGDVGELTDVNSEEYKEQKKKDIALLNATLTDVVRCFASEEDVKAALETPISSFKDYALILQRLVTSVPNWNKVPLDIFLSYQWKPTGDNNKTYLEIPKDVKQGTYLIKSQGPGFTQVQEEAGIKYRNAEGITHPFKRSEWYANSPYAKQTILDTEPTQDMSTSGGNGATW